MNSFVTIITPFFQAEKYLREAITSVLHQTHQNWELLLINDGSTDQSMEIALSFTDPRIRYFTQENQGVSAARNVGLANMQGEYFCFLDADDVLPPHSLKARLKVFEKNPEIAFADGCVEVYDQQMQEKVRTWCPHFQGNPLYDLIRLDGKSFFGITWMIKRDIKKKYKLQQGLTHCEDLYFYIHLARFGGKFSYTSSPILFCRDTPGSAMKNLKGLENGYRFVENEIRHWPEVNSGLLSIYRYKYKRAMFLAYLKSGQWAKAFSSVL